MLVSPNVETRYEVFVLYKSTEVIDAAFVYVPADQVIESPYLTIVVELLLVAFAVGAVFCETAVEVILNGTPALQALAKLEGPTDVSACVKTDLTYIYTVVVETGPVLSVSGLDEPDASGVTAVVGAVDPVQYA